MGSSSIASADVDALVVGAGPAGSASAIHLARQGHRVVLVDRAAFPRDKPCSEYMGPATVDLLERLGISPAELEQAGAVPLEGTTVVAARGARLTGLFARVVPVPGRTLGLSLPRRDLDERLVRKAKAAGAELRERCVAEELIHDRGRVAGVVLRRGDQREVIRSRLVIGADGLRSVVARRLGRRRHRIPRRVAFVAHVQGVTGLERGAELHVGSRGYVGLNPLGDGLTNVALVVPAERAAEARGRPAEFLFQALEGFPGVRGRVDPRNLSRPVLVTGPFSAWSSRVVAGGALLVGDAADFFDPFTGEGIYSALRGAELAAACVGPALAQPGPVTRQLLTEYQRARRRAFAGKWAVERMLGYAMMWPALFDRAVARLGRRGGMAHTLIGVTADLLPARRVLNPLFIAGMVL